MANLGKKVMGTIIGAVVGIYAFAYVGGPAITELFEMETSAWDSGAASLIPLIAIFLVLGIAVMFVKPAMDNL